MHKTSGIINSPVFCIISGFRFYGVLILFLIATGFCAQDDISAKVFGNKDPFGVRVFIENKGQFKDSLIKDPIYFVFDAGDEYTYFTSKGLVHKLTRPVQITEENREELEEGHILPESERSKTFLVNACWKNGNTECVIEKSERQEGYVTYGSPKYNAYRYRKIKYLNVYDHIDIEYVIPVDKEHGIKYNVILNPGADVNNLQIEYSGAVKCIKTDEQGNVVICTPVNDIIEYAPWSYYSEDGTAVPSSFKITDGIIGFDLKGGYDRSKTLIIDPWLTSISGFGVSNGAYDVDYDNSGNVFIYGGGNHTALDHVAKYNSSGVLQWIFSGSLVSPAWVSNYHQIDGSSSGNFVVDKSNGKTYVGVPYNDWVTAQLGQVIRLDANGNYDNYITTYTQYWVEIWDMCYNPTTGDIYGLGGGTTGNNTGSIINKTTGAVNPVSFNNERGSQIDIMSHALDSNGEMYVIYANPYVLPGGAPTPPGNKIAKINSSFTNTLWTVASTYTTWLEISNKLQMANSAPVSTGFNCLAVNANYLFYYDGYNLAAYSKSTGSLVASTTLTLNINTCIKKQGGIAVHPTCNYIYLGGNNVIFRYAFNGTSFTALSNISVGASTGAYIYDLILDNSTNTIYFCGNAIVGTYNPSYATCSPASTSTSVCLGVPVGFNTSNCNSPFPYVWDFGDGSPTYTGSTVSHQYAGAGNYIVNVTTNAACNTPAQTIFVSVFIPPCPCTPSNSSIQGCFNAPFSFNTSNCNAALSYTWNFGDGTPVVIGASPSHQYASTGNYVVSVTTNGNCNTAAQIVNVLAIPCPTTPPCSDCISSFAPVPGKKYLVSGWAKEKNAAQSKTSYTYPSITILYPSISGSAGPFAPSGTIIDGWQRIEGEFTIPASATNLTIKLDCTTSDCYYDDVRILPFDGSLKSYVYDPVNLRLVAELDERNYATLYEYDEDGKLVRVKKETEKGKMTIKENRDNTKK